MRIHPIASLSPHGADAKLPDAKRDVCLRQLVDARHAVLDLQRMRDGGGAGAQGERGQPVDTSVSMAQVKGGAPLAFAHTPWSPHPADAAAGSTSSCARRCALGRARHNGCVQRSAGGASQSRERRRGRRKGGVRVRRAV